MDKLTLRSGRKIPILGQGTWEMAQDPSKRSDEIEALRIGVSLGMSLIDTAEMYGSEELVAEALSHRRKEIFLVSKVLPQNATLKGTIAACENSLKRLKTDYLDLYLLHWRGSIPLEETLNAFQVLKKSGKILEYGVSNFDVNDMEEAEGLDGGNEIAANQVLYNLMSRGIEWDLLPWSQKRKIPIMAYSPFGHSNNLVKHPLLKSIAMRHAATPVQVALAWILRQKQVMTIPKASNPEHVKENYGALEIKLSNEDLRELDQTFNPPSEKYTLEMI